MTTLICRGSDGSGFVFDGARCCAVCGIAFTDVSRTPVHFSRERDEIEYGQWLEQDL